VSGQAEALKYGTFCPSGHIPGIFSYNVKFLVRSGTLSHVTKQRMLGICPRDPYVVQARILKLSSSLKTFHKTFILFCYLRKTFYVLSRVKIFFVTTEVDSHEPVSISFVIINLVPAYGEAVLSRSRTKLKQSAKLCRCRRCGPVELNYARENERLILVHMTAEWCATAE